MPRGRVRLTPNRREIEALLGRRDGPTRQAFEDALEVVRESQVDALQGKAKMPSSTDTGALVKSVRVLRFRDTRSGLEGDVGSDVPYASIIDSGRGEIVPRRAGGVLVWPAKGKGAKTLVFARRSGPVAARPWASESIERAKREIARVLGS